MKKIIFLTLVLPLVLFACQKTPEAFFHIEIAEPEVGQDIYFINDSDNGAGYEWDFGDGYISNEEHPVHSYQLPGTYEVILTVISKKGLEDKASMTLDILEPSLLVIQVLEYWNIYPVSGASVILYPTENDWINQQNMIIEGFTADDGIVVFANLDPIVHYVDVWEQNHDNYQLKEDDITFIETPKIIPHKVQLFVAYVDTVKHTKGSTKGERAMVFSKLERKATDKPQPEVNSDLQDWQKLYNRSIKLK